MNRIEMIAFLRKHRKIIIYIILLIICVLIPLCDAYKSKKLDEKIENINSSKTVGLQLGLVQRGLRSDLINLLLFNEISSNRLSINYDYLNTSSEGKKILSECPDLKDVKCTDRVLKFLNDNIQHLQNNTNADHENYVKLIQKRNDGFSEVIILMLFSILSTILGILIGKELK